MHSAGTDLAQTPPRAGRVLAAGLVCLALTCGPSMATPALAGGDIALPSGRSVTFHDVIWGEPGPEGLTVRFRFLEPGLAEVIAATPYDELEADMRALCESYAIGRIANIGPQPAQIIVSISDRPVTFGEADPEAAQIFEAYRRDGETCIWEPF